MSFITRRCGWLLLVALLPAVAFDLSAQLPGGLRPQAFAIRDARVILEPGKELAKATILVRDGLIVAVAPDLTIPPEFQVHEGTGLVVYPGFMDSANSWGVNMDLRRSAGGPPEPTDLAAEALATTSRDNRKGVFPEFEVATSLKAEEDAAQAWRKAGVLARHVLPESAVFGGQSALVLHSTAQPRALVMRAPIGVQASFRPPAGSGYPSTVMGTIAHARQTLLDAGYHQRLKKAFADEGRGPRPVLDPALDVLGRVLAGDLPLLFDAETRDEINRALDLAKEFGVRIVIVGGNEAWKVADRLAAEKVPVLARINWPDAPRPPQRRRGPSPFDPPAPAEGEAAAERDVDQPARVKADMERRHREEIVNVVALAAKGVPLAFSGQGLAGDKFLANVRRLVKEGLDQEAALKALTLVPADLLGGSPVLGRISVGRPANLVAFTGPWHEADSQVRFAAIDQSFFEYEVKKPEPKKAEGKEEPKSPAATTPKADSKAEQAPKPEPIATKPEAKSAAEPEGEAKKDDKTELPSELDADRVPKTRTGGNCLIRGATLVTVSNGTIKADLLVRQGKIAAIGPNLTAPNGVTVIPGDGLFVMPGIIDTHSHFAISGGVNEFTLSVVPEVRIRDVVASEDVQIYRGLAGGVTTARLLHGSANCVGGEDAVIKLKWGADAAGLIVADAPRGVKFALGENVKRSSGRFPNTRLGVEAVLVRAFTEAQAYQQMWDEYRREQAAGKSVVEPRRDLRLEALADILAGKLHVHCHCYRADEILMLLRVADRFGFKVKSLQHGLEGYKVAAEVAAHGCSLSSFSDWWAYKLEAFDAIPHNVALLTEAGATAVLKSDSNELMRHLYQEAAKVMKYGGLSETDALKTITLHAAQQLGLDHRLGSLEVGKDADLALFNAHPLSGFARCEMTLIEGEVYFERPTAPPPAVPPFTVPTARGPELRHLAIPMDAKGRYLIRGATIHPVVGSPIHGEEVLIEGGKIAAVGPNLKAADATVVDAKGLQLFPGLIDAGTILGLSEIDSARETQDFAEGGDFQPDLRAVIGINPDSELIPVTRANGVLAVVSRPTGSIVPGQSALLQLRGWVPQEMVLVDPLALQIDFPSRLPFFTGSPGGPPVGRALARRQREEKLRKLRELFQQAVRYDAARQKGSATPLDPRLEALIPYANGARPVIIQAQRRAEIMEALKVADDLNIKVILSGGTEAWKVADELKKRNVPVIVGPVMTMPQEMWDTYDAPFVGPARLHEAGVTFCIRSEGGTNSRNLPYEAAMAIAYGLPYEEGLKAVTLYPAQILGVEDKLGAITVGRIANLVLADGDLLQPTTQVQALFIGGVPVDPHNKQTRLYERYRQRLQEVKAGRAPLGTSTPAP